MNLKENTMVDHARAARMADRIKVIVAQTLERGVKDPRLGFVTVTDVRVSGDLQHASIFYTVYGSDEDRANTAKALASATGIVRKEVGKNLKVRLTPTIEFIPDALPENASAIEALLREAHERDVATEELKKHATYAGDEDPYAKPHVIEDDED